jgi:hypothetical protein
MPGPLHVPHGLTVLDVPQLSVPVTLPQSLPCAAQKAALLCGAQPHTLDVPPPPQVTPVPAQMPQSTVRAALQLSLPATLPQFF